MTEPTPVVVINENPEVPVTPAPVVLPSRRMKIVKRVVAGTLATTAVVAVVALVKKCRGSEDENTETSVGFETAPEA